jgi:hypothetical protein
MRRELLLIGAAKHALDRGDYDRALERLDEHEREFPRGSMARAREELRDRVLLERAWARWAR